MNATLLRSKAWRASGLGVLPNSEATFEFTIERPGVYTIFCGVADHRQRGMVAQITVQP